MSRDRYLELDTFGPERVVIVFAIEGEQVQIRSLAGDLRIFAFKLGNGALHMLTLSLQTWATGRPAPLRVLAQFLDRLVGHEEIRFARCSDLAGWRLNGPGMKPA